MPFPRLHSPVSSLGILLILGHYFSLMYALTTLTSSPSYLSSMEDRKVTGKELITIMESITSGPHTRLSDTDNPHGYCYDVYLTGERSKKVTDLPQVIQVLQAELGSALLYARGETHTQY